MREEFDETMRFWFDMGVDGFRIDVAHGLAKAEGSRTSDRPRGRRSAQSESTTPTGIATRFTTIYRTWRALADDYDDPRVFVAEAWVHNPERLAMYVRDDELHTAFNFDFLLAPWLAEPMRDSIVASLEAHEGVGAPPTWVLSNHDTVREVSRYARPQGVRELRHLDDLLELPADFELGVKRARAAALLMLSLPGGAYVYQGEELGLAEVEDLPEELLQDPGWQAIRLYVARPRRLPGADPVVGSEEPPFGFTLNGATAAPWAAAAAARGGRSRCRRRPAMSARCSKLYRRA